MRSRADALFTGTEPSGCAAPRISVVIPTFNEAKNLPHVLGLLPEGLHEVIVVDGRSLDGTVEVARSLRPSVRVVLQTRRGKGNALACGFAAVTGDIVVMLDADGSADPREIPRFVAALVAGSDFAKGSRFLDGGGSSDITPTRRWGNRCLNRAVNALYGTRFTDLCYGYNAFWVDCLDVLELDVGECARAVKLWGDGFEIETIINTRVAKAGLDIAEVPSLEARRLYGESNLNTWRDGARVLRALLVERINRRGTGRVHVRRSMPPVHIAGPYDSPPENDLVPAAALAETSPHPSPRPLAGLTSVRSQVPARPPEWVGVGGRRPEFPAARGAHHAYLGVSQGRS